MNVTPSKVSLGEWLFQAKNRLTGHGVEAPALESQLLAAHFLQKDRVWVLAHPETELVKKNIEKLLQRRLNDEPLAYILGHREFYGRSFIVNPDVLVPRYETELLISAVLARTSPAEKVSGLDLCTGSGCIGLTLALENHQIEMTLTDISLAALKVATQNRERLQAHAAILESDLFDNLTGLKYGFIVSNPPYIGLNDPLPNEVRNFEPELALFAGEEGLDIYKKILENGLNHLEEGGFIAMELGFGQDQLVAQIAEVNHFVVEEFISDAAQIPRVIVLRNRPNS